MRTLVHFTILPDGSIELQLYESESTQPNGPPWLVRRFNSWADVFGMPFAPNPYSGRLLIRVRHSELQPVNLRSGQTIVCGMCGRMSAEVWAVRALPWAYRCTECLHKMLEAERTYDELD